MESLLIVSVNVPVEALTLICDEPETANDLTPVFPIVILLAALVTDIPLPSVIVALANPEDEPINN